MFGTRNGSVWLEGALICNCPCRGIGWGVCNTPLLLGTPSGHWPQKCFPTVAPSGQRPQKCFPTVAPSGHWLLKWFPTAAPSGQRPPRCFPMAANEWRSPLSAGRVGAYCIRPQMFGTRNGSVWLEGALICNCPCRGIGWGVCNTPLLLGTPSGHWPQKCFPTAAPSGQRPQKCFPTVALSGHWLLKWFPTAAPSGHLLLKCFPTAAPSGHLLLKWFPTIAPSGQQPL